MHYKSPAFIFLFFLYPEEYEPAISDSLHFLLLFLLGLCTDLLTAQLDITFNDFGENNTTHVYYYNKSSCQWVDLSVSRLVHLSSCQVVELSGVESSDIRPGRGNLYLCRYIHNAPDDNGSVQTSALIVVCTCDQIRDLSFPSFLVGGPEEEGWKPTTS